MHPHDRTALDAVTAWFGVEAAEDLPERPPAFALVIELEGPPSASWLGIHSDDDLQRLVDWIGHENCAELVELVHRIAERRRPPES